ncbi:MAG: transporter substrate-binding domain-containing protein [Desulfobulbus sp.]|jgi:ABC-type amino acid transport substrate-binding protein|uniref:substrate-binding periplasmic protein n=1 Tax=Desulfobulbus sp. TaxID=895 RepID=UPI002843847F|nr:transporter substrate-binding domain-containing protein [Desulfobulbus sp.]MDR2550898.1 transporter substrate-binding domain-containing protein [Desulfobulbus sp.]
MNNTDSSKIDMARFFHLFFLPLLAALLLLTGCAPKSKDLFGVIMPTKALKVGTVIDAPPLAYAKDGTIAGLEPLFAEGLAEAMNRRLELVPLSREELYAALRDKKIDIVMAGMTVAEAQRHRVASTTPYLVSGQTTLVRLGDYDGMGNGIRYLTEPSIRLGVVTGGTADAWLKGLRPRGSISRFATAQDGVQALMKKGIDVFIFNQTANYYYASLYIDKGLTPGNILLTREELAWGVRTDNDDLREAANKYLAAIDQNGDLLKMLEQTIPFYRDTAYSPVQQ